MAQIAGKYDLTSDEARIAYCAAEVSRLAGCSPNAVEREIYTTRAAEAAGITPERHEAGGAAGLQAPRLRQREAGRSCGRT
ncbi:MAG: hypothetical protein ACLT1A_00195 [Dysosmobacter sp.]